MSKPIYNITHGAIGEAMCCYTEGSYKDADIALTEYENSIRADERRKFAEWLQENVHIDVESGVTVVAEFEYTRVVSFIELLTMYEKEQKE